MTGCHYQVAILSELGYPDRTPPFSGNVRLGGHSPGCSRRQGRAFFSAFIGAKRRPFTAGAAGRIEDHPEAKEIH